MWLGHESQEREPRVDGEEHRYRQDEEYDGDHHPNFLAAPSFHDRPSAGLPNILRLRPEHIGKRRTSLDGDHHAVDEPGQANQAGAICQALKSGWQVGSSAGISKTACKLARKLPARQPAYSIEGPCCPLAGGHRKGQQLCHGGEFGQHSLLTEPSLSAEPLISTDDPCQGGAHNHRDDRKYRGAAADDRSQSESGAS
jgi:hypothetical protein